jgi:hypothetical protein
MIRLGEAGEREKGEDKAERKGRFFHNGSLFELIAGGETGRSNGRKKLRTTGDCAKEI